MVPMTPRVLPRFGLKFAVLWSRRDRSAVKRHVKPPFEYNSAYAVCGTTADDMGWCEQSGAFELDQVCKKCWPWVRFEGELI